MNEHVLRRVVLLLLFVPVADGLVKTFFFIIPFWVDQWRVIYNLKTRSVPGLWQGLDFMQQFPRAYLSLVKIFTGFFDYSYTALRLPSFVTGCCAIALAWRLRGRIYKRGDVRQYLFPIIIAFSVPFTLYFVQTKQYTMDMLLSLAAIWQLLELLALLRRPQRQPLRYAALCASMLIAPFFSYSYSIAVAPVFVILLLEGRNASAARRYYVLFPLLLSLTGIALVYVLDVRQLLADGGMKAFWKSKFAGEAGVAGILGNLFSAFALVGSGFVFEIIFGVLGVAGFINGLLKLRIFVRMKDPDERDSASLYAVLMVTLVFIMFLAGKLPLGESRLNTFFIPSAALLIIDLLARPYFQGFRKVAKGISIVLFLGVSGNIFTTIIGDYTEDTLPRERSIYFKTAVAIRAAKSLHLPILTTPGVAWPYEDAINYPDTLHTVPGDWILKTHPAYHMADSIPVYAISKVEDAAHWLDTAADKSPGAIVFNGNGYTVLKRLH